MPESKYKSLVKSKQTKCEKGSHIKYQQLEIQDYLTPSANLTLEDQQLIFSLRCEMIPLKVNFSRKESLKEAYCVNSCQQIIDNEHLTWCEKFNKENDFRYSLLLNGF